MSNWKLLANPPARRVCVEGLEDRYALSATFNLTGFDTIVSLPQLNADTSNVWNGSIEFTGPILDIPTALAEGRTATVTFLDGVSTPIQMQDQGAGRLNLSIDRELPLSGTVSGEVQLTKTDNPNDRIVIGFQILVAYDATQSSTPRAIVQTVPTYSQQETATAPPAVPPPPAPPLTPPPIAPPVTTPPLTNGGTTPPTLVPPPPPPPPSPPVPSRTSALIGQSAFEAGATRTAYDFESIRGVRTVVELPASGPVSTDVSRNELGYTFLRSTGIGHSEWSPDDRRIRYESIPVVERRNESRSSRSISVPAAPWTVAHGTPLAEAEPADFSPSVRELLERIAMEDANGANWMTHSDERSDEKHPTDRRPYWLLAALVGLGAGQYYRARENKSAVDFI